VLILRVKLLEMVTFAATNAHATPVASRAADPSRSFATRQAPRSPETIWPMCLNIRKVLLPKIMASNAAP
jgi:hypothetical protein